MHSTSATESIDANLRPNLQQNVEASWYINLNETYKCLKSQFQYKKISITVLKLATYFFPHAVKTRPDGVAKRYTFSYSFLSGP